MINSKFNHFLMELQALNKIMATRKLFSLSVATILLSVQAANCYILLTANLEDVHSIAKQIAASPVANQLQQILRRASSIFNDHLNKNGGGSRIHQRAEETEVENNDNVNDNTNDNFEIWKPDLNKKPENFRARASDTSEMSAENNNYKKSAENNEDAKSDENNEVIMNKVERRNSGNSELVELGKNASFYLKSIKKIFESV